MENPMTWGEAERIVDTEYKRWWRDREDGMCGLSLARRVTDALRDAGLLELERPAPLEVDEVEYDWIEGRPPVNPMVSHKTGGWSWLRKK
jgi:hypothetical protein